MIPLKDRKKKFEDKMRNALESMDSKYNNREFLNDFYKAWTVTADEGSKMKWEMAKYQPWNTKRRMITFYNMPFNKEKYDKKKPTYKKPKDPAEGLLMPKYARIKDTQKVFDLINRADQIIYKER